MSATIRIPAKRGRIRVADKASRTYNGRVYHSAAEARYAAHLDLLVKMGTLWDWKAQVPFPIIIRGTKICSVVIDFIVVPEGTDAKPYYVEVKGMETAVWKLKRKLLLACYPGIDLRVVPA